MVKSYPNRKTIAIDIDGTLINHHTLNAAVVSFCERKKQEGYELILWSARGKKYAEHIAQHFKLTHIFDTIIAKPSHILDDQGWNWIKYTCVIKDINAL